MPFSPFGQQARTTTDLTAGATNRYVLIPKKTTKGNLFQTKESIVQSTTHVRPSRTRRLLFAAAAVTAIALATAGCSKAVGSTTTGGDSGKTPVVAYAQAELINSWRVTNQKDMEAWAKKLGIKLISTNANQDPAKQLSDAQSLLAQKPQVLIVSPLDSQALVPIVAAANRANVPLITIDRTINAKPGNGKYLEAIAQSHVESGKLLAEKTVELLTKKYGSPKGNVVHVQGMAGASPVVDANKGWDEVMAKYPEIKTVATADAGFTKQGGIKVMEDFLQRFPKGKIDVVRTDYSDMTMGAIQAIKAAGRDEILGNLVGEGGQKAAVEAVVKGDIARETQTPPFFGELALKAAEKVIAGKSIPAHVAVPIKVFDADKQAEAKKYLDNMTATGSEF